MNKKISFVLPLVFACGNAYAHSFSDMTLPAEGLHAHLNLSGAYRSENLVSSSEKWNIPGLLMGGEAIPSKAGLSLDEALLNAIYRKDEVYAQIMFGRHAGAEELELEHVFVGRQFSGNFAIEGGRMAGIFTPFNGEHSADTGFANRRLVYDAFWGGQYNDEGARIKANIAGFDLGLELWSGDRFPSAQKDSNKTAADAYARYTFKSENWKLQLGGFHFQGYAKKREDSRYSAGHSHSSALVTTDPTYFDGDVSVDGALAILSLSPAPEWTLGASGEISRFRQEGRLWDTSREAIFENQSSGLWGEIFARFASEKLNLRAERLKIENDLRGSGAGVLAEKLKLRDLEKDPYRYSISYEHFFSTSFRSRLEWSEDFSTSKKQNIFTLSAVWIDMIAHSSM